MNEYLAVIDGQFIANFFVWLVATLLSVTLHEAAHAYFGVRFGDETAKEQVTLDPTPHITRHPLGMLGLPLLSFIFTKGAWMMAFGSAPYDPVWAYRNPRKAALMAAAGPMADFVLALLAAITIHIGLAHLGWVPPHRADFAEVVTTPEGPTAITTFVSVLFSVNILLGVFNLIPLPPLDGNAVVPLVLTQRLRDKWNDFFRDGTARMFGIFIAWAIFGRIAWPLFEAVLNLLYMPLGLGYG